MNGIDFKLLGKVMKKQAHKEGIHSSPHRKIRKLNHKAYRALESRKAIDLYWKNHAMSENKAMYRALCAMRGVNLSQQIRSYQRQRKRGRHPTEPESVRIYYMLIKARCIQKNGSGNNYDQYDSFQATDKMTNRIYRKYSGLSGGERNAFAMMDLIARGTNLHEFYLSNSKELRNINGERHELSYGSKDKARLNKANKSVEDNIHDETQYLKGSGYTPEGIKARILHEAYQNRHKDPYYYMYFYHYNSPLPRDAKPQKPDKYADDYVKKNFKNFMKSFKKAAKAHGYYHDTYAGDNTLKRYQDDAMEDPDPKKYSLVAASAVHLQRQWGVSGTQASRVLQDSLNKPNNLSKPYENQINSFTRNVAQEEAQRNKRWQLEDEGKGIDPKGPKKTERKKQRTGSYREPGQSDFHTHVHYRTHSKRRRYSRNRKHYRYSDKHYRHSYSKHDKDYSHEKGHERGNDGPDKQDSDEFTL